MGAGNIETKTNNDLENDSSEISAESTSPEVPDESELENPDIAQPNV